MASGHQEVSTAAVFRQRLKNTERQNTERQNNERQNTERQNTKNAERLKSEILFIRDYLN